MGKEGLGKFLVIVYIQKRTSGWWRAVGIDVFYRDVRRSKGNQSGQVESRQSTLKKEGRRLSTVVRREVTRQRAAAPRPTGSVPKMHLGSSRN